MAVSLLRAGAGVPHFPARGHGPLRARALLESERARGKLVPVGGKTISVLSLVAQIKAKPGKEAELRQVLAALVGPIRAEEGCLNYDLHIANDDPGFFTLYENSQTVPLWERHMDSPHLEAFKARTDELVADWKLHQLTRIA